MPEHELPLAPFLAGDLDPASARAVDEHLLSCDSCWLAVREDRAGRAIASALRESTDPQSRDRIRLVLELAPTPGAARRAHRTHAGRVSHLAVPGALVALVLAVLTTLVMWPRQATPTGDSTALHRVVALATNLPRTTGSGAATPVVVWSSRITRGLGQAMTVQTYAYAGHTALVATSPRPFPMPPDAHMPTGRAMPWTIARGRVTVYCPHAGVLLAGPESPNQLAALARALHLP